MDTIRLELQNRTKLVLTFQYEDDQWEVAPNGIHVEHVAKGGQVAVHPPKREMAKGHFIEYDYFPEFLSEDTVLRCDLLGWNLELRPAARF